MYIDRLLTHAALCMTLLVVVCGGVLLFRLDYRQPSWFWPSVIVGTVACYLLAAVSAGRG